MSGGIRYFRVSRSVTLEHTCLCLEQINLGVYFYIFIYIYIFIVCSLFGSNKYR
jgi:hypothetical protein